MVDRAKSTALTCAPCLRGDHTHCTIPDRCTCQVCYPPEKPPVVIWEDPPSPRSGTGWSISKEALDELQGNPKRWALLHIFPKKTTAQNKLTGLKKLHPEYEFAARRIGVGDEIHSKLFGRYMGEDE